MEREKTKEIYNAQEREGYWQKFWEREGINEFDPESSRQLFTIDTPPPTISGALHLGHVFSYTQAEVIARYRRLAGFNVRYPMGFDNNGLPTERLVEKEKKIKGRALPLAEFVRVCLEVTDLYKEQYKNLWKSLGLSIDWRLEYSSISREAQRLAQTVFKELFEKGAIYQKEAIALYCPTCSTSVAQAEVEDNEETSVFYDIAFTGVDGDELIISTTRPELLPACEAVFVHPDDERYAMMVGKTVTTPLQRTVPILVDDKVSMEKGTGAVMCCTYGDETDVYWVRKHNLPERIILTLNGKFIHLEEIPEISSKSIREARNIIVALLRERGAIKKEQQICHAVGVHERCDTPIEFLPTKQWFVKILEKKDDLIRAGERIQWYPSYMRKRYEEWVSGLKWDWCISRERFFGVPIPVFVCDSCEYVYIPDETVFPIDPKLEAEISACPKCGKGGLIPEKSVLDTWFTSSLTPDINNTSPMNGKLAGKLYPMSMRPQGHDIIRTWVVYSIVMGLYRHQDIPWHELMISGHILLQKGEKISKKTGGGAVKPEELIRTHSADAIRYAMYGASLGRDAFYEEQEVKKGKKLIVKLYNAGKLILSNLQDFETDSIRSESELEAIDRWIIARSRATATEMARAFEHYEYSRARLAFEDFFWRDFCDNYLEIVKGRLWSDESLSNAQRASAHYALYHAYLNALTMISPFIPHITEEMYHAEFSDGGVIVSRTDSGFFATREGQKSIHCISWPVVKADILTENEARGVELMLATIAEIRKYKSIQHMTMGARLSSVILKGKTEQRNLLHPFWNDLTFVIRAEVLSFQDENSIDVPDTLTIRI
ncbi:valine--tRNA ligase [Candidatus Uhrbacteria bacterium]|nr:valine--tRNA ligase [Candidatus Uhrbacteria bacterium]